MAKVERIRKLKKTKLRRKVRAITCTSWTDLTEAFGSLTNEATFRPESTNRWIFRGQADSDWPLENCLRRTYATRCAAWKKSWLWNDAMVLKRIEGQLAFDFASKARLYGLDLSVEHPVALLSAMQHFRAPTRLLDWTYSSFVALYFALECSHACESAAVWAINITALHATATRKVLPVQRMPDGTRRVPPIRLVDFGQEDNFNKYVLPDLDSYHRSALIGEPALDIVVPLIPAAQNERLSAQQGLFLCPSKIGTPFMEQLEALMDRTKQEWIVKIVVPRSLREEALRRLLQMNIHHLSLFPGADGLGRFCALKAELWGWD